jgi:hypothetical protein
VRLGKFRVVRRGPVNVSVRPFESEIAMQIVELHFATEPKCDYLAIKSRAETLLAEQLDTPDAGSAKDAFLFFHKQHPIQLKDAVIAPQTALLRANKPINIDGYADDIQQSWGFRDCAPVLSTSNHTILVTEMMARSLPAPDRVHLFHGVLQAVIELTKPIALVFKHSQQVVQPRAYLDNAGDVPILRPGSLNVRFFNISNSSGDMLMDTRGLSEIGLHDLQCHFRDLDPNEVSALFNTDLFENGPVIESGNTVAEEGAKWICQFEDALVPPEREVLDLNPGPPYAAGGRE